MNGSRRRYQDLSRWLLNHALLASVIVLFCSASARLFMAMRADVDETIAFYSDPSTYIVPAQNLLENGAFLNGRGEPMVDRTPGYPAFLALLMVLAGRDLNKVLIVQTLVLSFTVVVLYLLARRVLPPVMAFAGALLAALSPWGAVLAGIPMSDGSFLFVLALVFLVMKLTTEARSLQLVWLGGMGVGLLSGSAVLIRPVWPLIFLVLGAMLVTYSPKRKGVWVLLVVTFVCAMAPIVFWQQRNQRVAYFNRLSDIPGKSAFRYLAARVKAEVTGQNRHTVSAAAYEEDRDWARIMSVQEADNEHWSRAVAVFRENPFVTIYCFVLSATEHAIHPSPDVLVPAKLTFRGDVLVLAVWWMGLLILALLGCLCAAHKEWDDGEINRRWLLTLLMISSGLTLLSGISFAAGSRLRAPLELIVPMLAAIPLVRGIHTYAVWKEGTRKVATERTDGARDGVVDGRGR